MKQEKILKRRIRALLIIFITGLVLSGITAFPLEWEVTLIESWVVQLGWNNFLSDWIHLVYSGIHDTLTEYPFLSYGTDWLAFSHIVIAVAFIGPLKNPVRNIWVIQFGMIACAMVIPLALIAGQIRGIPFFWQAVDCSFGILGIIPLWLCHYYIRKVESMRNLNHK